MLWVEAKNLGVSILIEQLRAETLVLKMKQVVEDKKYVVQLARSSPRPK